MKKKIEIDIPDYFAIKHYKEFHKIHDLEPLNQMVETLVIFTDLTRDEITSWGVADVSKLYGKIADIATNIEPKFFPLIEWGGVVYGYTPIHKMTLGEWIDLENLTKDSMNNLEEIMALLYRPLKENKVGGLKWTIKNSYKVFTDGSDDIYDYYSVEKYDNKERKQRKSLFADFPADIAMGTLSFFLEAVKLSLESSKTYSLNRWGKKRVMTRLIKESPLANIMVGCSPFTTLEKHQSWRLEENDILWI